MHSRDYESIDSRYTEVKVKKSLSQSILDDLEIYLHSIEESLLHYHQTKISEINERIAELWQETYQGRVGGVSLIINRILKRLRLRVSQLPAGVRSHLNMQSIW